MSYIEFLIQKQHHTQCGNSQDFPLKNLPITRDRYQLRKKKLVFSTMKGSLACTTDLKGKD